MAKMSEYAELYAELKIKAQKSNMRARTLAKAIEAVYGKGTTRVIPAAEMASGDKSGAVVKFEPCENFGIEAFLDPMEGGPFFMSLYDGEPMAEAKTVPRALAMVGQHIRAVGGCSRR